MANWNKSDIGKIIVYKNKNWMYSESKEKIALCKVYPNVKESIGAIDYPIALNSRYFLLGLIKGQEKETEEDLKKVGDWYLEGRVSMEEKEVLCKISKNSRGLEDIY